MAALSAAARAVIQQQCVTAAASGAAVATFLAPNGDVVVAVEDRSVADGLHYRARIRFPVSALEAEAAELDAAAERATAAARAGGRAPAPPRPRFSLSSLEHELNRGALFEVHRRVPAEGVGAFTWQRMRPWPLAPDGRLTVQAPPFGQGATAPDAVTFAINLISRADAQIMESDAVEQALRRFLRDCDEARSALHAAGAERNARRAAAEASRAALLRASLEVLGADPFDDLARARSLLALLDSRRGETLGGWTANDLARFDCHDRRAAPGPGSVTGLTPFAAVMELAEVWAPSARVGTVTDGLSLRSLIVNKKLRPPRVEWRVVLEPLRVPVQGLAAIGRVPETVAALLDGIEKDLLHWTMLSAESAASATAMADAAARSVVPFPPGSFGSGRDSGEDDDSGDKDDDGIDGAAASAATAGSVGRYSVGRRGYSALRIVRTVHVPVPVPMLQVLLCDAAVHCLVDKASFAPDTRCLGDTSAIRRSALPPFWRGSIDFDITLDPTTPQPSVLDDEAGSRTVFAALTAEPRPVAAPVPRLVNVSYCLAAGAFSSPSHVALLREWRTQCLERPLRFAPRPFLVDEAFVEGLDSNVRPSLDSAAVIALATSLLDVLAAPVDLRKVVPTAYWPLPFPLAHAPPPPGEAAGGCAAAGGAWVGAPAADDGTEATSFEAFLEPVPERPMLLFMGGRASAKLHESRARILAKNAAAHDAAHKAALAAYEAKRPVPWRFSDEVGSISSIIWYRRPVAEGGVARGDTGWTVPRPLGGGEVAAREMLAAVAVALRRRVFGGAADGARLLRGADRSFVVSVVE